MKLSLGSYLILLIVGLMSASASAMDCPDGHIAKSQSRESLALAGPRLGSNGAIWTYKEFEVGRVYKYCLDFPVLKMNRKPNYKRNHDNLVLQTLPPPASSGADLYIALVSPTGVRYGEPERHNGDRRIFTVKYKMAGTWGLEFKVRSGANKLGIDIAELYDGFVLNSSNFTVLPLAEGNSYPYANDFGE